ncbi:MAG: MFS transporter, partial [Pyrinomonadaceae bacterium]
AAISLVFAVAWELVCENPAVDLSLLAHRGFAIACVLIFLASIVYTSGISIVIPVIVQDVLGFGAFETGLVGMPGAISVTIGVYIIGYMIDKFTAKYVIAFGYFASILAFLNMATLTSTFPFLLLIFNRTLVSISMTFGAVGVNATAYYGIDPKKHNAASSMLNLARILGTSFGYSVVATILVSLARRHIVDLGQNFSELNPNFTGALNHLANSIAAGGVRTGDAESIALADLFGRLVREAYTIASNEVLMLFAAILVLPLILSFFLNKKAGEAGH